MLKKMKLWAADMTTKTMESRPKCFPIGAALPSPHKPTIWYTADGYVTSTPEEQTIQSDRMRGVKAIYTRGEGFTVKTDAERTNYLMLSWFLKKSNQEVFTKPNVVAFEFAGSAVMPVIRIIEAMQSRPECGWAVYCKASGSCWADTLLGKEDKCIPEGKIVAKLEEHANGKKENTAWVILCTIGVLSCLCCCCCVGFTTKAYAIMKPSKPKESEGMLVEDDESELPGSDAASEYERAPSLMGSETSRRSSPGVQAQAAPQVARAAPAAADEPAP